MDTFALLGMNNQDYTYFVSTVAHSSYSSSLLRILLPNSAPSLQFWNSADGWKSSWEEWKKRLIVFAYDWLGRQIAFDLERKMGKEYLISILEPGTGELLETDLPFYKFIDQEIVDDPEAALSVGFYEVWKKNGGAAPLFNQCLGYKVPLFLGGHDTVENLVLTDIDVYVSLCGQMYSQIR